MRNINAPAVRISEADLHAASTIAEARLPDSSSETERIVSVRAFLTAAFAVERALHAHSRCMLVNHCGTHGANNLSDATADLFRTLENYASSIRSLIAQEADAVAY